MVVVVTVVVLVVVVAVVDCRSRGGCSTLIHIYIYIKNIYENIY